MNNYNFTQSLDGLKNIEAETITASNASFSSLNNSILSNCDFVDCSTSTTPVNNNSIVNKIYTDSNFMFKTGSVQESISGFKTFLNRVDLNGGTALIVGTGTSLFNGVVTFASTLTTNNITATPSSIAGINNIYTNLDPVNGLGIINIGTFQNNINIKCNLNINESVYGTTQNTILNMEGNSLRFTNNGSTNGNYIFTINESGTFNPLVINKTSVNIGGDLTIGGELSLYDTTPSTKSVIISLLNNDVTLDPNNTFSTTYNFKVNDSGGTTSTPLTISTASTTINNNLISNSQATFNTSCPISSVNPSANNHLVRKDFCDNTFQTISGMASYLTSAVASATYQTIAGMSSYLTSATASATYQTIAGMSSYLTTATASATYQPMIVGSIIQMAMGTVPTGYLACNGGSYSSSTYPALSAFLNFTYGGSSGSGMFQVPDFRGMFLRGAGTNGIDSTYASTSYGSLQPDGIKTHTHDINFGFLTTTGTGGGGNAYNSTSPNYNNPDGGTGRAVGFTSSNNNPYADTRPGNFAVLFCIKY
jgi:microcystin-dependent protein